MGEGDDRQDRISPDPPGNIPASHAFRIQITAAAIWRRDAGERSLSMVSHVKYVVSSILVIIYLTGERRCTFPDRAAFFFLN